MTLPEIREAIRVHRRQRLWIASGIFLVTISVVVFLWGRFRPFQRSETLVIALTALGSVLCFYRAWRLSPKTTPSWLSVQTCNGDAHILRNKRRRILNRISYLPAWGAFCIFLVFILKLYGTWVLWVCALIVGALAVSLLDLLWVRKGLQSAIVAVDEEGLHLLDSGARRVATWPKPLADWILFDRVTSVYHPVERGNTRWYSVYRLLSLTGGEPTYLVVQKSVHAEFASLLNLELPEPDYCRE